MSNFLRNLPTNAFNILLGVFILVIGAFILVPLITGLLPDFSGLYHSFSGWIGILAIIVIIALGFYLLVWRNHRLGGIILLVVGLTYWFGPSNVIEIGNNTGTGLAEVSRNLNGVGSRTTIGLHIYNRLEVDIPANGSTEVFYNNDPAKCLLPIHQRPEEGLPVRILYHPKYGLATYEEMAILQNTIQPRYQSISFAGNGKNYRVILEWRRKGQCTSS